MGLCEFAALFQIKAQFVPHTSASFGSFVWRKWRAMLWAWVSDASWVPVTLNLAEESGGIVVGWCRYARAGLIADSWCAA